MNDFIPIPGYPDYLINRLGEVYSEKSGRVLTPFTNHGYIHVTLQKDKANKNLRLHRLLAITFLEKSAGKEYVNHKNGVRSDNRLENLEWCTSSENNLHACRVLKKPPPTRHTKCCKPVKRVNKLTGETTMYAGLGIAAEQNGVTKTAIQNYLKGSRATCLGYHWEFVMKGGV